MNRNGASVYRVYVRDVPTGSERCRVLRGTVPPFLCNLRVPFDCSLATECRYPGRTSAGEEYRSPGGIEPKEPCLWSTPVTTRLHAAQKRGSTERVLPRNIHRVYVRDVPTGSERCRVLRGTVPPFLCNLRVPFDCSLATECRYPGRASAGEEYRSPGGIEPKEPCLWSTPVTTRLHAAQKRGSTERVLPRNIHRVYVRDVPTGSERCRVLRVRCHLFCAICVCLSIALWQRSAVTPGGPAQGKPSAWKKGRSRYGCPAVPLAKKKRGIVRHNQ